MDNFIHHNMYPIFTKCAYVCLIIVLYFFDPKYILSYIALVLFLVILAYSKFYESFMSPLINQAFFSRSHLNTFLQNPNGI